MSQVAESIVQEQSTTEQAWLPKQIINLIETRLEEDESVDMRVVQKDVAAKNVTTILDPSGHFTERGVDEDYLQQSLGLIPLFAYHYVPEPKGKSLAEHISDEYQAFAVARWYEPGADYPAKVDLGKSGLYSYGEPGTEGCDPDLYPLAVIASFATDELFFVYESGLVAYIAADGSQLFSRMD